MNYIKILVLTLFAITGCRDYNQFEGDKYAPVSDETDGSGGSYTWENPTTPKEKFSFRTTWGDTSVADTTKIKHTALFYYKDADNWELFHELTSTLDDYNYGKTAPTTLGALKTIVDNPAFNSASTVNNFSTPDTLNIFGITFKTDRKMDSTTINRRFRSTGLTSEYDLYIVEGNATSLPSTTPYLRATYNFSEIFDRYKAFVPSALTFFVTDASPIHPDPYQDEVFKTRLENIDLTSTVVAKHRNFRTSPDFSTFDTDGSAIPPADLPASITDIIKKPAALNFTAITSDKVMINGITDALTHDIPATTDYGTPSKNYSYTIKNDNLILTITDSPTLPPDTLLQYKYTALDYDAKDGIYKQYIPKDIYVYIASDERSDADKFKGDVKGKYVYETRDVDGTPQPMNPLGEFNAAGDAFIPYIIDPASGAISGVAPSSLIDVTSATKAIYGTYTFDIDANTIVTGGDTKSIKVSAKKAPKILWENIRAKYKYISDDSKDFGRFNGDELYSSKGNFILNASKFSDRLHFVYGTSTTITLTLTDLDGTLPLGQLGVAGSPSALSLKEIKPSDATPLGNGFLQQGTTDMGTLSGGDKYTVSGKEYTLAHCWNSGTSSSVYVYKSLTSTGIRTIVKNGASYKIYQEFNPIAKDVTFATLDDRITLLKAKLVGFVYAKDGSWVNFSIVDRKYTVKGTTYTITAINASIDTVTTDSGTEHRLLEASGQYGVSADGSTIPFGTEIAVKRDTGKIDIFADKINKLLLKRAEPYLGDTTPFTIDATGAYTHSTRPFNYKIGLIIDDNTALVTLMDSGREKTEVHGLRGGVYGVLGDASSTTVRYPIGNP